MLKEFLINYSNGVIKDPLHHCQKHRWACQRFLDDLTKSEKDDPEFPFVFDELRAEKFCGRGKLKEYPGWVELFQHTKGVLAGKLKVFEPIENFIFGNVYGWVHKETGLRRFSKMYWQVGKKNSKSMDMALLCLYELFAFLDNEISEVYLGASKTEQAKIVYNEAVAMLSRAPYFYGRYQVAYNRIKRIKDGSIMRTFSKDDRKLGDGVNPQLACIDEYHCHQTSELYDILQNAMGARAQPLLCVITTAGFDLNNPCYRVEYDLCSKILNPDIPVNLENYFVMINELDKDDNGVLIDSIKNEECWVKANPILCSYEAGRKNIRTQLKEALECPEKMTDLLTKHFNVWIHQPQSSYLSMDKWGLCKSELPETAGKKCFIGIDLAAKIDLTSVGIEFIDGDKYIVQSHSFMPEETLDARRKRDKAPYDNWVRDGLITCTPGAAIDFNTVVEWIKNAVVINGWKVEEICIDPWGSQAVSAALIDAGYKVVDIVQGIRTLSEPTKHFREMVYQKRIIHDGNAVLTWAISNAIADSVDRNENILLSKKHSRGRIDPIAALINAHVRALASTYEPIKKSSRVIFA